LTEVIKLLAQAPATAAAAPTKSSSILGSKGTPAKATVAVATAKPEAKRKPWDKAIAAAVETHMSQYSL